MRSVEYKLRNLLDVPCLLCKSKDDLDLRVIRMVNAARGLVVVELMAKRHGECSYLEESLIEEIKNPGIVYSGIGLVQEFYSPPRLK